MVIVIFVVVAVIIVIADLHNNVKDLSKRNTQLIEANTQLKHDVNVVHDENLRLNQLLVALRAENDTLRKSLSEAPLGFPSLLEALRQYDFQHDRRLTYWLKTKSHPAYTSAEVVRIETQKRRDAEAEARRARILLEYYESSVSEAEDLRKRNAQLSEERLKLEHDVQELTDAVSLLRQQFEATSSCDVLKRENAELSSTVENLRTENGLLRKSLSEAPLGFPSLLEAISLYDARHDASAAQFFENKTHPAYTAAQTIRIETQKRREAESGLRRAKLLLEYYFSIFPDAQEFSEASEEESSAPAEASQDKSEDIARRYLSSEEYYKLSITQRNQLALDRFWASRKSKRIIGRLYEQYIGWLYEHDGWIVEYFGISKGFSDLGRDLICHKDNTTLIVQCKNWSKSKRIYEKHIFQLFGTTYEYMKNNPFEEVHGVFFTSTQLSELARSFAKEFRIELYEEFQLKLFPIIKCNIGREGEKIYHLPFDQQYYTTRIKPQDGDFYCATVAEAESRGFRRAYRWHGGRED